MMDEARLVRQALNIPYTRWHEIEPLIASAKDGHTKEVLRRLILVKRRRANNHGN